MANSKKMDYVLLGFLSHEPMTGYEMKKRLDTTLKFFWGGSFGSIYPTLNQLEKEGKVTKEDVSENGREKLAYRITEQGRKSLKEWLAKPVEKDELRYETLLKLFFGNEIEKLDASAALTDTGVDRPTQRRGGNECRSRWSPYH